MLAINFTIDGTEQISRVLDTTGASVDDLSPAFDKIGSNFLKTFDMNFASRGSLYGSWKPRRDRNPWPLLEKTGNMRGSFVKAATSTQLALSNTSPYFAYHQSAAPRYKLPRRVMMKLRQEDARMIIKEIQAHIQKGLSGRTNGIGRF